MPDLSWNKLTWDGTYNWETGGEEWSVAWGGSEAQWFGCIYPRIHRFLPADRVLEIAPGFGRWTKFLLPATNIEYLGIDISEECVNRCRDIFRDVDKALFYPNDGLSLHMVPDEMFDFVFSFDSLVHAEIEVLEAYIPQILKKLQPNGAAFIHHSNWLNSGETGENPHNRAVSVSAEAVAKLVQESGGIVLLQEVLNWGMLSCIDCFSVFSRADNQYGTVIGIIHNPRFMDETSIICQTQSLYSRLGQSPRQNLLPMTSLATRKTDIIRTISSNDQMFAGNENHYFSVGQSALDCINISLLAAQKPTSDIRHILDLPCGHGRVLRYLRAAFPEAEITACDLMRDGVDFCASTFGAIPVYSHDDPSKIPLKHNTFDLIWVGSLFTHFDADLWPKFLRVFCSFLRPGGILVFSTHGSEVYRNMVMDNLNYGISSHEKATFLYEYERDGFGYISYPGFNSDYGLSLSSPPWVLTQIAKLGGLRVVYFSEKAWDNHHDCFACVRDPDWQQRKDMNGYKNAFMDLVTPKGMWARFEQLCSERSDVQTLWYVLGSRHKALEWIHSVGVCLDAGLGSYVPSLPPANYVNWEPHRNRRYSCGRASLISPPSSSYMNVTGLLVHMQSAWPYWTLAVAVDVCCAFSRTRLGRGAPSAVM